MKQFRFMGLLVGLGLFLLPTMVQGAEATPPTAPANLQATVASGDPAVTLTWAASTDASGIKAYRIDRSLDQTAWTALADNIVALTYKDITSGFGLHYFYRVSAVDGVGNVSAFATTDASTDNVNASNSGSSEATYTSRDRLVVVQMPAGAAVGEISCNLDSLLDVHGKKVGTSEEPVIFGPYGLSCKTTAGSIVTDFQKNAIWTLDLKGKLKGLSSPTVSVYDDDGKEKVIKNAQYDEKGQSMRVEVPPNSIVVVRASKPKGVSPSLLVVILFLGGVVAGLIVLAINRKKKLKYEEYLRDKYYEL